jgi:ribonuclease BN (tRNA processing enzyme)
MGSEQAVIVPLGTRGWMPQEGRQTVCTFVKLGETQFLLDCGTGVSRLLEPSVHTHLGSGPLTILFSHYHLDHFAGLAYLPGLLRGHSGPVRLAGPRRGLADFGLREACERLTSPPLSSQHYSTFPFPVEIMELGPEGIEIDGVPVAVSPQAHPGGSMSLRLANALCYATDLAASTHELPLAQGVELLIHEVWSRGPQAPAGVHSGFPEALERACRSGVPRLMPVHFMPDMPEPEIRALGEYSSPALQVLVPEEGMPFEFSWLRS